MMERSIAEHDTQIIIVGAQLLDQFAAVLFFQEHDRPFGGLKYFFFQVRYRGDRPGVFNIRHHDRKRF